MIKFTLDDKWWIVSLPLRIKYYIFKFILYLCRKNALTTEIIVTTPYIKMICRDIMDVPLATINKETGDVYRILLKDVQVVYKVMLCGGKRLCV